MRKSFWMLLAASAILVFAPIMRADDTNDPSFLENGSSECGPPASPTDWCAGYTTLVDPQSGIKTLVYVFNTSEIPTVVAGDVKIVEPGTMTVGDDIRFETLTTGSVLGPVAFIYSNDTSGGLLADMGLPSTYSSNAVTVSESSAGLALWQPSSSTQPGYTGLTGTAKYANTEYGLQSSDAPEPGTLCLMGSGLLGAISMWRRKKA
jgi:hypothetical protein